MNDEATDLFLGLTPDAVLDAVEASGLRCTSVCHALNSFENRVYEIQLKDSTRLVAKFYRPGRWTAAQILEEHAFLADLHADEVPVCPVLPFPDGTTLKQTAHILFCLFQRFGGRAPEELDDAAVERLGMLVARMHNTGARVDAPHRVRLGPAAFIDDDLDWLQAHDAVPEPSRDRYFAAAREIGGIARQRLLDVPVHRIHGDLHLGNLLLRDGIFHVLDFDDMAVGPAVQDLWLLLPGRDAQTRRQRELFIEAYGRFRAFDRTTLALIEPLRGMRYVHYAAWLARRWHDPIFPQTWPQFGTEAWWAEAADDLQDVLAAIRAETGEGPAVSEEPLSNADFFWDWDEPKR